MKYLILIYGNDETFGAIAPDDMERLIADTNEWQRSLRASGEWLGGYGVDGAGASTIRLVDGAPVVTDGPYLEAKEYVGSMDMIDVATHERAVEVAGACPFTRHGSVELVALPMEADL